MNRENGGWGWAIWLAPPVAVGIALRLTRLTPQILTGDELHTVNGAIQRTVLEIVQSWTYRGADYCVPLTAFFRFLMDRGIVLSEMDFRLPMLAAGILTVAVAPVALATHLGRRAAIVLGWLLATSYLLVMYSRIVRSYGPVVLLGFAAVMAFECWWRTRSRSAAAGYVACAALASYFHLGAAPFVFAPLVYGALEWFRGRTAAAAGQRSGPGIAAVAGLSAAAGGLLTLLLLPARASLLELVRAHGRGSLPALADWGDVLQLLLGTTAWPLTLLLSLAIARGAWRSYRRAPDFVLYIATLVAVHCIGLAVLAPNYLEVPAVASRYLLVLLPFLLGFAAVGLTDPWASSATPRVRAAGWSAVAALGVALVAGGPLARPVLRSTSFAHSGPALFFTQPPDRMPAEDVPGFYRELAQAPDDGRGGLLEFPWMNLASRALRIYQDIHGREVLVGLADARLADAPIAYRNIVDPDPEAFLASRARYLVVHLRQQEEEWRIESANPHANAAVRDLPGFWSALTNSALRMVSRLRADWGEPVYEDSAIRVWDLDLVRSVQVPGFDAQPE